jgi:hypothetical protein
MMKKILRIIFLLILVVSFSCEEQGTSINCPDCTAYEPLKTNLEIELDISYSGNATSINVYEGNLEDSVLYRSFNTSEANTTISVTINKKYTVTATYYILNDKYIAVDSATPRVKYDKELCDNPCYFIYDKVIDLRLKYTR